MSIQTVPRLRPPAGDTARQGSGPLLDPAQRSAVAYRGPVARVLGAPGTGKTTLVVEVVLDRVLTDGLGPDEVLVLGASRALAARLRSAVTSRLAATTTEPLARTMASFAFGLLRQCAALAGEPPPRLLTGPEQDAVLRDLLAGHASGEIPGPQWPEHLRTALRTRGFRTELRDLLMRAVERGVEPPDLDLLARRHNRPEWSAAAAVLREYDQVTALSRPGGFDPAWVVTAAANRLVEEPAALSRARRAVRFVVVDDAQELTAAGARLLEVLCGAGGPSLLLVGDPDVTTQGFRGAEPGLLREGDDVFVGRGPTFVLGTTYRQPAALADVTQRLTRRIGAVAGARHRSPRPSRPGGRVDVSVLRSASQEAALIAAELRRAHLIDGLAWSEQAVVVRGGRRAAMLRRVLAASGIPVATAAAATAVADEPAVRPLLLMLEAVLARASDLEGPPPLDADRAADLLTSPIGGADPLGVRRLRRLLRRQEVDSGGSRSGGDLLAGLLFDEPAVRALGADAGPVRRVAAALARGAVEARSERATAETVLWEIWAGTGLAARWRAKALAGGPAGVRADRDLDAVLALFDQVASFVDRLPLAGAGAFLEHVRAQDLPGDRLVVGAPVDDSVCLVTPAGAAGRQWRFVVVAGVQEGVWPDLRLRGTLLGSQHLVDVLAGRGTSARAAQAAVRYDETRLLLTALSRASDRLLVTAVRNDDEQPSAYLDVIDPPADGPDREDDAARPFAEVPRGLSLPDVVADLRRQMAGPTASAAERRAAAAHLARLASEGIAGADPASWWANRSVSDDRPRRAPGQPVPVSPSALEAFRTCQLRWLLTAFGGDGPSAGASVIGTLVHEVARDLGDTTEEAYAAEVTARWAGLGLGGGWAARRDQDRAREMVARLARYVAAATADGWQPVGREVPLSASVGRARVTGRADRVERNATGAIRVVDLKTGSTKPSAGELSRHPQLGAYQAALMSGPGDAGPVGPARQVVAGAALLQLGSAAAKSRVDLQQQSAIDADDEPGWAADMLGRAADGMGGATFQALAGPHCRRCQVRACCPVQPEGRPL